MLYTWKVRALKSPVVNYWWRYWQSWCGRPVGNYDQLPGHIRRFAAGRSFVDVGCMWGVDGEYAFAAEAAGAARVTAVDIFGPTPEFERKKGERRSRVEFVLGDVTDPRTIQTLGCADVVFCAGVLYHHPSPFDLLTALRLLCRQTLILRTSTIPEINGVPNAAVFFPKQTARGRALWELSRLGLQHQAGISAPFDPGDGYGNWFWGLTPSCVRSMLDVSGFRVEQEWPEPFAWTGICAPFSTPFAHRLPGTVEARELGAVVSAAGGARPA